MRGLAPGFYLRCPPVGAALANWTILTVGSNGGVVLGKFLWESFVVYNDFDPIRGFTPRLLPWLRLLSLNDL